MNNEGEARQNKAINQISSALITHVVFAFVNIIIVLTNVYLPRYLNKPRVVIENVRSISDEKEKVFGIYLPFDRSGGRYSEDNYDDFEYYLPTTCVGLLESGKIAYECKSELTDWIPGELERIAVKIDEAETELKFWRQLIEIPPDQRLRYVRVYETTAPSRRYALDLLSTGTILSSDGFADFRITSVIQDIESDQRALLQRKDEIEKAAEIVEGYERPQRSGEVIFEVVFANEGHADAVLGPSGALEIDGVGTIPLLKVANPRPSDGRQLSFEGERSRERERYEILPSGGVVIATYQVDKANASVASLDGLRSHLSNFSTVDFKVIFVISDDNISGVGEFSPDTKSFVLMGTEIIIGR